MRTSQTLTIIGLIFLFIQAGYQLQAQKSKVTWSEEFDEEKGDQLGYLLKDDGKNIYFYVSNIKKKVGAPAKITPGIMKFDYNMKVLGRQDYTATASEKETIKFGGMFYCGGQFLMLTHKHNKAENTTEIMGVQIDRESMQPKGSAQSIWKISAPSRRDIDWEYVLSADSSKILLVATYEQKDEEQKKLAFKVIDKDLKTIVEKQATLKQTVESYRHYGTTIDNAGNIYNVGKAYFGKTNKEAKKGDDNKKVAAYNIAIDRYSVDGKETGFKIEMGEKLLDNLSVQTDPTTNDLCIISTYADIKNNGVIGYSFHRVSSTTGEIIATTDHKFPLPMIKRIQKFEDHMVNKAAEQSIPKYYGISDFIIQPDGRIFVIFENNFTITTSGRVNYTTYYSRGMIATMLSNKGEEVWIKYIPKIQFYNSLTSYLYHTHMVLDDKIVIFYNDLDKNVTYDWENATSEPKTFNALKEMSVMAVEISNDGKATRKEFTNSEQIGTPVHIRYSEQSGPKNFILYGYKYNKQINKLGLLQFN